jgi:hypothetical protein
VDCSELGISSSVQLARISILHCQLQQSRHNLQATEGVTHKMTKAETDKLENAIKNWAINKTRHKDSEEREGFSIRKPNYSCQKVNPANLSISRRNLDKSVSRQETTKDNEPRNPSLSINRSSQNTSNQQLSSIRNSTPPHSYKLPTNSSDKKSVLMKQSSIMSAKLEDITPVMLNFDFKETSGSRINFLSNKTEEENPLADNLSQPRNKRKSDFFDLRDRMRKPNMATVMNNRLGKR